MKKTLLFAAAFLFLISILPSCKKDSTANTSATYYIKGKKDGVAFNYTVQPHATIINDPSVGFKSLSLTANSGSTLEGFNIVINFFTDTAFQVGVYKEDYSGNDYIVAGVYNPNSQSIVYGTGIQSNTTVKSLTVNILTKTSTEITGTFEGAFYKQDVTTGTFYTDYILVTEGEFKLAF